MSKVSVDKVPPKWNGGSCKIQRNKRYKVKSKTNIRIGVEGSALDVSNQPNFSDKNLKSIKTDRCNQMVKYDGQQNLETNFDESKYQPIDTILKTSSPSPLCEEDAGSNEEYQFSYPGILTLVINSDQTESKISDSTTEEQSHFLEDYQVGSSYNEEDTSNTVDEMDLPLISKSNILHSDEQIPTMKTVDETGPPMSRFEINKDDEEKSNIFDKIEPKNTDTDNTQSSERDLNSELVEANQDVSTTNLTSYSGTNDDDTSRSEMPPPSRRNLIEQTWLLALFISVIGLLLLALGLSSYMWYTTSNKEAPPSMPEHQSSNIIDMIPEPAEFVSTQSDLQSMPEYQSQDSTDIFQMVDKAAQLVSIRGQSDLTWLFVGLLWLIPLLQVIILASNFCCCCIHRQNLRGFLVASFACFMISVIILVTLFFV